MGKSPFDKVDGATGSINSEYMRAGRYLVYIKRFISKKSRKDANLALFECIVVEVLDASAAAVEPKGPHIVGNNATFVIDLNKDAGPGALKSALRDILGIPEEDVTSEVCERCAGDSQPLAGLFVEFDNRVIKTKEKGLPFTLCRVRRNWKKIEVESKIPAERLQALGLDTSRAEA
jgi:hypothetical protein